MNIHEFQAKALFAERGIPVPEGRVVATADEAASAAQQLGVSLQSAVVVKSQIHAGGRGKGSIKTDPSTRGVKVVTTAEEARQHTAKLLGNVLVTHQTGPEGRRVKRVLIEKASNIARELYAAVTLDRETGRVTLIASTEGGMDIEEVAEHSPEKIIRQAIDPAAGMQGFYARKVAYQMGLSGTLVKQVADILTRLYHLFVDTDASMLEINPLVITKEDRVIALDGKMNFDANALYRQPKILAFRDLDEEDPKEQQAKDAGLSYVSLTGNIGCLVNGAGLAMATMDIIKHAGGQPANFLDVGGGATAAQVTTAFKIILSDPSVKAILINIFAGIAKCDVIAEGVITAVREVGLNVPLVVRLEGTNVDKGKAMLRDSGLDIEPADNMFDAARKVVRAAGGQR